MSDMHFLILGMRSGKTACGLQVYAFFPQTETAYVGRRTVPGSDGEHRMHDNGFPCDLQGMSAGVGCKGRYSENN